MAALSKEKQVEEYVAALMRRAGGVVLIDANLLLIYLIALYNFDKVKDFIPGDTVYFPSDHLILKDIIKKARKCIVTPNILTEVSNLTFEHLPEPGLSLYIQRALGFIKQAKEHRVDKDDLLELYHLPQLGFSDSTIIEIAKKEHCLVLTEDLKLANTLGKEGCFVLNINHLRQHVTY